MATSLLRRTRIITPFEIFIKKNNTVLLKSNRSIMTSRLNYEKIVEDLQKNPYFDKYAQKIAKLQNTSPEEFMKRIEEKERKVREEKVLVRCVKKMQRTYAGWIIASHLWRSNLIVTKNIARAYSQISEYKYITTPIFYVNAYPHIGHLYTAVIADSINRFNLMQGYTTLLSTGTDEHGNKVQLAAEFANLPIDLHCKNVSEKFQKMCDTFEVKYNTFVRTTEPFHKKTVQYFWNVLENKNYIYKSKYSGWYCISDETFLSNEELIEKKTNSGKIIKVSAESGHPVEWTEEDTYKFKLSLFEDDLKHWLKDENTVQPLVFHKILNQWIEKGLCQIDLSISRPTHRVSWGIPTPSDPNQTIYVWLDALINYLSAVGYPHENYKRCWPPTVQVIGKDILKFHGIFWPAFLIAAGLELPQTLLCHSHWTVDHEKMSKSKGNVISPFDAANQFTTEGLRYYLLRDSVPHNDSNYSHSTVLNILNKELADTLGNLVTRCTSKLLNPGGKIPNISVYANFLKSQYADNLRKNMEDLGNTAKQHYESFYIHHVVDAVMATLRSANTLIDRHKPWELIKAKDNATAAMEVQSIIALALEATRISAIVLFPIVPVLSTTLLNFLSVPLDARHWEETKPKYLRTLSSVQSEHFGHNNIIFPKIKLKV